MIAAGPSRVPVPQLVVASYGTGRMMTADASHPEREAGR